MFKVIIVLFHRSRKYTPARHTAVVTSAQRPPRTAAIARMAPAVSHHGELAIRSCMGFSSR